MTRTIDNFTITETSDKIVVDYLKTTKDKADSFLTLTLGILISIATYLILRQGLKTTSYVTIIAGLIFAFQAVIQTMSGLSRVFQPTKDILVIDKTTNKLTSRHSPFMTKVFLLRDIQSLIVTGQTEKIAVGDGQKMNRTYCTISAIMKDEKSEILFTINTNKFLRSSTQSLATELQTKAHRLANEINRHLKSQNNWTNQSGL